MSVVWRWVARAVVWPLVPLLMAALALVGVLPGQGTTTLREILVDGSYVLATLVPYAVGVLLTVRVPRQGAGWAFLGLASSLAWSGFTEEYAMLALGPRPDLPAGGHLAAFADSSFALWFVFLALCLHYTAAVGRSRPLPWLPWAVVASAATFQLCSLLRRRPMEDPFDGLVSPWAVPALAGPAAAVAAVAVLALGLCLLVAVAELFSAFRSSRGEERQRLLWLVAGAVPLAPAVVVAFAVSYEGHDWVAVPLLVVCVTTLSCGAGLAALRYRLYDVERVVADSTAYALSTGAVAAAFGLVVLVISRTVPVGSASPVSTVVATLAAAGVARPAYVWARDLVDRRFNRRRFDAVRMVAAGLSAGTPDVEAVLRTALGDSAATLLFAGDGGWVTGDGRAAEPGTEAVDIVRQGTVTARLRFDPSHTDPAVVEAVAVAAAAEIDNLGLRAELARQVEQVTESRTRLATAHLDERRRMERDLHDGAQQHLLAIALQLQSAQINGSEALLREEVERAVTELGTTVQELRRLAHGLQPAALAGGGLRAAVEDLAGRIPLLVLVDVEDRRYPTTVETAAWFVVAEGVANAIKHAGVNEVGIAAVQRENELHVAVTDDGAGGAYPGGRGLQGLTDRVAALGGRLALGRSPRGGTRLEAVFPCGS